MEHAQKLFTTRGGTMILAGIAAVLAGIAVFVYVHNYRNSVKNSGTAATVLVAKSLIPQGTSGEAIAKKQLYQAVSFRESQVKEGAITDPSSLTGRVAATDIFPNQQLTTSEFKAASGTLASTLAGVQRAITIPLDSAHGMIGNVEKGDRVDVYAGFNLNGTPVLRLIMQNVAVVDLKTANRSLGGQSNSQVVLRTTPVQASKLAFASDNGRVWLVLRPSTGGTASPPNLVTVGTEILNQPSIQAAKSLGDDRWARRSRHSSRSKPASGRTGWPTSCPEAMTSRSSSTSRASRPASPA
jgi:Flp pilus assembly protein CpaB